MLGSPHFWMFSAALCLVAGCSPAAAPQCGYDPSCTLNNVGICSISCYTGMICDLNDQCETAQYQSNGDGTVTDEVTGLVWQQQTPNNQCSENSGGCTWQEAQTYCQNLQLAGGGWTLPTREQLFSLVDLGGEPTIDASVFPSAAYDYWTSTAVSGSSNVAWAGGFASGTIGSMPVESLYSVRCVR
jgi:hypothetical protein